MFARCIPQILVCVRHVHRRASEKSYHAPTSRKEGCAAVDARLAIEHSIHGGENLVPARESIRKYHHARRVVEVLHHTKLIEPHCSGLYSCTIDVSRFAACMHFRSRMH